LLRAHKKVEVEIANVAVVIRMLDVGCKVVVLVCMRHMCMRFGTVLVAKGMKRLVGNGKLYQCHKC